MDRRGQKKAEPVEVEKPIVSSTDKSEWEEVKYAIAWRPIPSNGPLQIIIIGRALGLRSDGLPFIADYWLTADYDDNRDWEEQAKKRLDTFLGCECSSHAPCAIHRMYIEQWEKQDIHRSQLCGQKKVPKVLEVLHKAERARREAAQNIAIPRH